MADDFGVGTCYGKEGFGCAAWLAGAAFPLAHGGRGDSEQVGEVGLGQSVAGPAFAGGYGLARANGAAHISPA